jgi:predicted transcriptional regulator YdeE
MWKTKTSSNSYFYLIGVEKAKTETLPEKSEFKQIPSAKYAVASVPSSLSAVDAWTEFYNRVLPEAGYVPANGHNFDFEYYPHGAGKNYELWTPVQKKG